MLDNIYGTGWVAQWDPKESRPALTKAGRMNGENGGDHGIVYLCEGHVFVSTVIATGKQLEQLT